MKMPENPEELSGRTFVSGFGTVLQVLDVGGVQTRNLASGDTTYYSQVDFRHFLNDAEERGTKSLTARNCQNCRFWSDLQTGWGECRLKSPAIATDGSRTFPETAENDWCGEFDQATVGAEEKNHGVPPPASLTNPLGAKSFG